MGTILCATRGGEASVRTQQAAIERARAGGDRLAFIYVLDMDFMIHALYGMRSDVVKEEMEHMADFLLAMAIERAQKGGVEAEGLIREGRISEELKAAVKETGAHLVVLGRPADESLFRLHELEELAARLSKETGVEFVILPEG